HKFLIDILKLVMRARAVEAEDNGIDLREKLLSSPDEIGRIASPLAPLANFANRNRANRIFMEKAIGVHLDKNLPTFHTEAFERWFRKNVSRSEFVSAEGQTKQSELKVALFHTCVVNYNEPQIGRATVRVLQKNNIEVADPEGQNCCGMPYLDSGRVEPA